MIVCHGHVASYCVARLVWVLAGWRQKHIALSLTLELSNGYGKFGSTNQASRMWHSCIRLQQNNWLLGTQLPCVNGLSVHTHKLWHATRRSRTMLLLVGSPLQHAHHCRDSPSCSSIRVHTSSGTNGRIGTSGCRCCCR